MDAKKSFLRSGSEIAVVSFVKPMYNVFYKMFGEVAMDECVVSGVWLTTVHTIIISFNSKSVEFLLCR